jgi:hypothetical protein
MYGITRIDKEINRTHSWHVHLTRRGIHYNKHFSDGVYGGKQEALNAAKEYKDSIISKHSHYTKKDVCSKVRRNNQSGIAGVGKYASPGRNGKLHWFWLAYWTDENGSRRQRKFMISTYGEDEAFDRAVKLRKKMLSKMSEEWHK